MVGNCNIIYNILKIFKYYFTIKNKIKYEK